MHMDFVNVRTIQSPDILKGAAAIADFLFGHTGRRREIYYLVERTGLPVFRLGNVICARRSTLDEWIVAQERAGLGGDR